MNQPPNGNDSVWKSVQIVAQRLSARNAGVELLKARGSLEKAYSMLYSTVNNTERMELKHDIREFIVQISKLMERVNNYSKK